MASCSESTRAMPADSMQKLGDLELAEKLRREDPEHYATLVRMHLSFVLDLAVEESEPVEKQSGKAAKKWFGTSKVRKQSKGVMEGAPLTQEGICQVYQLIEFLKDEPNITQEGIFRRSGKISRQQELKALLNQGQALNLDQGNYSVHDCASVLKNFLADLPEPLLTDAHYQAYCQVAEMCSTDNTEAEEPVRLLRSLQLLLLDLPSENKALVTDLLLMLNQVASHEDKNKMSVDNLSTLFTPHLLCPRKLSPEEFHANSQLMSRVVSFMIKQGNNMFKVPPKLATDVRAYWADKDKAKEEHEAVTTVFSFVDRQLTAEANSSNPTEAALAQLYAHIQSLPESANKRRLVKQFNKENGQGTPLVKKQPNARSLGDSIKRHIFTKALKRYKQQEKSASADDLLKVSNEEKKTEATSKSSLRDAMMTPRSRKPVLVLSSSNLSPLASPWKAVPSSLLQEAAEEGDGDDTSLSSTFKEYLQSRSVLTASPVSLSCDASPEKLSNSLLYCLDGNDPSAASTSASYVTTLSNESSSSSGSRKRACDDSLFADHSVSLSSDSAKKSTLESSYSSTMGSSIIRETSL
ncbi:rho GTPase-activating protein 19 isoform X2 [Cloeon dipterum]|uniref:rho GTPase-activating protein 19 isoform X2 n=1 Tax=Cloeon dipterum TaxID=197152 RepID=UPI00321FB951